MGGFEPLAVLPGHDHDVFEMICLRASRDETIRQVDAFLCLVGLYFILDVAVNSLQVAVIEAVSQLQEILWRDLLTRGIVARIEICFCDALDTLEVPELLSCGNLVCTHASILLIDGFPRLDWPILTHDLEPDDSVQLGAMQVMLIGVRCVV